MNVNTTILPCSPNQQPVSRWKIRLDLDEGLCTNNLQSKTVSVFKRALETSNDNNMHLRDIYLWNDLPEDGCHEDDYMARGMKIMTTDGCFENVHPDYLSIYDFTQFINGQLMEPDRSDERDLWLSFANTGVLDYLKLVPGKRTSFFEQLRKSL